MKQEAWVSVGSEERGGRVRFMAVRCLAKTMESGREYGNNNNVEVTTTIGTATNYLEIQQL